MSLFASILEILKGKDTEHTTSGVIDPTVYRIQTQHDNYTGVILYQDHVVIRLKCERQYPVKIIKENIIRINIVSTQALATDLQWKNFQLQV
jgi:hypothetical protein